MNDNTTIARLRGAKDNQPRLDSLTPEALVTLLTTHERRASKDGPAFSPAVYPHGSTRSNANVQALTMWGGDYDYGVPDFDAIEAAGINYVAYTTHSHTPEAPRWRVFVLLSHPIITEDWPAAYQSIAAMVGTEGLDMSVKDPSRLFFLPSCPPDGQPETRVYMGGQPVDVDALVPVDPSNPSGVTLAPTVDGIIPFHQRNQTLTSLGGTMRRRGMEDVEIYAALLAINQNRCQPPLDEDDILTIAQSVSRYAPAEVVGIPMPEIDATQCTDSGNARRLVNRHGENVRYVPEWRQWMVWDGKRWAKDGKGRIVQLAMETAQAIHEEAASATDDKKRLELAKWWAISQSERNVMAMIKLAKTDPRVAAEPTDFDKDPMVFNVRNGTVDLRTGTLKPHDRDDLLTRISDVSYDPKANAPTWLAFMDRIMDGKADLVEYHQRALGYTLTGETGERCMFFQYGHGSNGKSTLLEAVRFVFGEYATIAPPAMLLSKNGDDGVPNDVAKLAGTRFVTASESDDGKRLAEAKIKQLTGDEAITARFMYAEFFDFTPQFKIWFATNHKPEVRGSDNAIWNRIKLLPYTVEIPKAEQDAKLRTKLAAEASGILAWAVQGCLAWQRDGLGAPEAVTGATGDYREEMDSLGDFLDDLQTGEDLRIETKHLYKLYVEWSQSVGERPLNNRRLAMRLRDRGFSTLKSNGRVYWMGLGIQRPNLAVSDVWKEALAS